MLILLIAKHLMHLRPSCSCTFVFCYRLLILREVVKQLPVERQVLLGAHVLTLFLSILAIVLFQLQA